jgi:hypothetical protein
MSFRHSEASAEKRMAFCRCADASLIGRFLKTLLLCAGFRGGRREQSAASFKNLAQTFFGTPSIPKNGLFSTVPGKRLAPSPGLWAW